MRMIDSNRKYSNIIQHNSASFADFPYIFFGLDMINTEINLKMTNYKIFHQMKENQILFGLKGFGQGCV